MGLSYQTLFGRRVVPSTSAEGAIGATINVGSRTVKPPIAVANIVAKLAGGATAPLSYADKCQLDLLGVEVRHAALGDADRARIAEEYVARGLSKESAVDQARGDVRYQAVEPISISTYFRPV